MNKVIYLPVIFFLAVVLRLWGNLSVQILTSIDPRPLALNKRLFHWIISIILSLFIISLYTKYSGLICVNF